MRAPARNGPIAIPRDGMLRAVTVTGLPWPPFFRRNLAGAVRRVVLIDFDWRDADRVPELLSRPGIVVGMVAGEKPDDVGVRVAELCGLRQSVDLADLTREFFDLAIVGEASPAAPRSCGCSRPSARRSRFRPTSRTPTRSIA